MWLWCVQQKFTVEYDTSSSDLILPDVTCEETCDGHRRYNASASTSSELKNPFDVRFRDGSILMGNKYRDLVEVAGLQEDSQIVGSVRPSTSFTRPPLTIANIGRVFGYRIAEVSCGDLSCSLGGD
jgi:hypothetical protein